ncbi:hypothetical protein KFZ76_14630 [Methylovulum psychrotolerans]|uniref:hypothetical protein n=1 Tax=Methylovulum psychrotolerans TaxID=1704499 RepID=UPI001BFF9A4E|nr:hypothetical protein [Methylovulum psychrotolerans]MBT9098939.1 hypothetical protein [Methylovulum psychrotolerans]
MKPHSARAILILESPWELDERDANRSSVLPFIEGVSKLAGDIEVYHADFYDKSSFKKALECLCRTKFKNTIVYIAAHGSKNKVGNVKLDDALFLIGEKSRECNITGVMLGTCFVGENTATMEVYIEGTNIKWCAGYSSASTWLEGTLIDCAILKNMLDLDAEDFADRDRLIDSFAQAIAAFSNTFQIGEDYHNNPVKLEDGMAFVVQPTGQGHRARTVTQEVFETKEDYQLP